MTNLIKSRFGTGVDPRYGRYNTEEVENMAHIVVRCPGTKNMKIEHHQKVCEVVERAITKATKRNKSGSRILCKPGNRMILEIEGKLRPDFVLVVDEKWAEWVGTSWGTNPQQEGK